VIPVAIAAAFILGIAIAYAAGEKTMEQSSDGDSANTVPATISEDVVPTEATGATAWTMSSLSDPFPRGRRVRPSAGL
jgi:hypothetical protein